MFKRSFKGYNDLSVAFTPTQHTSMCVPRWHHLRVYNPQAQPRFEYAHTQDQPEYEQVIVHDGRTIDFDQLSDVDDDNEDFDAIAEVEERHEMMMWLWCR